MSRSSGTLSGGESQRIRLATQIGSSLMGVLYVLDEPSIGLHQRDNERLLDTLKHLRDLGNTLIVVEHDEDTMREADYIVDIGPGAGIHGGNLVFAGTPQDFTAPRRLGDDIESEFNHIRDFKGYDHFFVVDGWQKNILGEVGTLSDPKSGRKVEILSSHPGCMVYTGNWLSGGCPVTKSSGRYSDYAGVAIECQGYPDAVNHPDFPTVMLHEGELYCQKIVFRLRN